VSHHIFVTRRVPEAALDLLRAAPGVGRVEVFPGERPATQAELHAGVACADGVLSLLTDAIDAALLAAAPRLRVVANVAVGYNNVDLAAATARGIAVTNTPGVLTEATADLTMALLLAVARRIVEGDALVREGRFGGWGPLLLLGADLAGRTLGIVGAGRIGAAVARRAVGFELRLRYANPSPRPALDALGACRCSLDALLAESDFVTLHVPLTPATRHLIGAAALARMKQGAYLVNTSRGPVVDEGALVAALRRGLIAGAALDVFEAEPALAPGLAALPNVVLAPHVGSATIETRTRMATMAAQDCLAALRGVRPTHLVNEEAWTEAP
jgi:glyoxylate reductase